MSEEQVTAMEFTGANGAKVKAWVNAGVDWVQSWFVTKGMTASTGGQAWRYVKGGEHWPDEVTAAVYDHRNDEWLPVRPGDRIVRKDGTYTVERPTS